MTNSVIFPIVIEDQSADYPGPFAFWLIAFLYASFAALTFQKLVLPLMPELHAGNGLLHNDAIYFHNIAAQLANRINTEGWGSWTLFPGAAAHVGILAALYALFGPDPAWFIPINAAAHASGAMLIYKLGGELWNSKAGKLGGLLAASCFLIFPSALQWYGQIHRDSFAIAGTLMILLAWLRAYEHEDVAHCHPALLFALSLAGALLLGLFRPYLPLLVAGGLLASFLTTELFSLLGKKSVKPPNYSAKGLIFASVFLVSSMLLWQKVDTTHYYQRLSSDMTQQLASTSPGWSWHPNQYLPEAVDRVLGRAAETRSSVVHLGLSVGAGSSIDTDIVPSSSVEVIAYLPRALWVGLLSPFPSMWLERISATRLVGAVETAIWYLIVLGGVITIARAGSLKLFAGVVFTFSILTVIAFIHPNVGTLYRMRYGLWMFVLLLGACGWAYVIQKVVSSSGSERATADTLLVGTMKSRNTPLPGMNRVAASGTAVLVITFVCYLGLLIRDLLLVNQLGFGGNLDALFTALMIPMFFVSFLAMPMADALTVPFVSAQSKVIHYNASLLRHLLGFAILLLGTAMTLVILTAPILTRLMLGGEGAVSNEGTTLLIRWFAPILLLSAWTVTGNAALNSLNRQRQAAFGQWFVPVVTIVALGFVSTGQSVQATIAGMLLGTLLNVFWVAYHLKSVGINFLPSLPSFDLLTPVLFVYRRLLLAVFLPAILVPLNYFFAASINAGSVSAWAFASKIVVLFSGLASVGATAVVLPHLARLLAHGGRVYVRQDANLLLVLASWLGGLLSVGAFLFADPLFAAILSTNLSQEQLVELAYIVKVGILQLPMAIAGALVTKIAIVSGSSRVVMHAALFGFITNLLLNLLLVPQLGMMGVAVGALAGTVISTVSLILSAHNPIGLRFKDVLILFSSWLVWAGVCVAMSSRSVAALVSVLFAVAAMTWTQYNLLHSGRQIIQKPV